MDEVKNESEKIENHADLKGLKDDKECCDKEKCYEDELYKNFEDIDEQTNILIHQIIESQVHYYNEVKFKNRSLEFKTKIRSNITLGFARAFAEDIARAPENIAIEIKDYFEKNYYLNRTSSKIKFCLEDNKSNKDETENKMKDLQKEVDGKNLSKEEIEAKILEKFPNAKFIIS